MAYFILTKALMILDVLFSANWSQRLPFVRFPSPTENSSVSE